jgi:hypothetical protein
MVGAWSPLWQYFIPVGHWRTLAEMKPDEKALWRAELDENVPGHYTTQFRKWLIAERGVC